MSSSYLRLNQGSPGSLPSTANPAGTSGFFHHPAATNDFLAVTNSYFERFSSSTPMMAYQTPDSEKFNNFYATNNNSGMHNSNANNARPVEQQSDFFLPYLNPTQSQYPQQQLMQTQHSEWVVPYEQCNGNEALKRFAVSRLIQQQDRPDCPNHLLSPPTLISRDDSETSSHTTTDKSDGKTL